jgi:hypothetical protein
VAQTQTVLPAAADSAGVSFNYSRELPTNVEKCCVDPIAAQLFDVVDEEVYMEDSLSAFLDACVPEWEESYQRLKAKHAADLSRSDFLDVDLPF